MIVKRMNEEGGSRVGLENRVAIEEFRARSLAFHASKIEMALPPEWHLSPSMFISRFPLDLRECHSTVVNNLPVPIGNRSRLSLALFHSSVFSSSFRAFRPRYRVLPERESRGRSAKRLVCPRDVETGERKNEIAIGGGECLLGPPRKDECAWMRAKRRGRHRDALVAPLYLALILAFGFLLDTRGQGD